MRLPSAAGEAPAALPAPPARSPGTPPARGRVRYASRLPDVQHLKNTYCRHLVTAIAKPVAARSITR